MIECVCVYIDILVFSYSKYWLGQVGQEPAEASLFSHMSLCVHVYELKGEVKILSEGLDAKHVRVLVWGLRPTRTPYISAYSPYYYAKHNTKYENS